MRQHGLSGRLLVWQPVFIAAALLLAVLAAGEFRIGGLSARDTTQTFIWVALVCGMYVYTGVTGIVTFGHLGFSAIGAYVVAILAINPLFKQSALTGLPAFILTNAMSPWIAVCIAAGVVLVVAIPIGLAIGRLKNEALSIGTFAFLLVLYAAFSNWDQVTGGTTALVGVPLVVGKWSALLLAVATIVAARAFRMSSWGIMLAAARDDEVAAASCGVNVGALRFVAFVAAAVLMGIAGAFQTLAIGVISVDTFYIGATSFALAMLVIGGRNSLSGAVVGTLLISLATTYLSKLEQGFALGGVRLAIPGGVQEIIVGILMLAVLIQKPLGIVGYREFYLRRPKDFVQSS
mgnify:CR=1 FL=1